MLRDDTLNIFTIGSNGGKEDEEENGMGIYSRAANCYQTIELIVAINRLFSKYE